MTETPEQKALPADQGKASGHDAEVVRAHPAPKGRTGRLTALLALLLASAAMAGVGCLYFMLVQLDPNAPLRQGLAAAQTERRSLERSIHQQEEQWREALQASQGELQARLESLQASVSKPPETGVVSPATPPNQEGWALAEARHLLRAANHRLLMERDFAAAREMLQAADATLAALDDPALHEVRTALSAEILALQQVPAVDVQGLYLRLEALKGELPALMLARRHYRASTASADADTTSDQAAAAPEGFLATLAAEFRSLVRFRRLDAAAQPMLTPDEAAYLELNLRLMLEQAQLAVLRRDQLIFANSLNTAHAWAQAHLDTAAPEVQTVLAALVELQKAELNASLPDISASLAALAEAQRARQ